MSRSGVLAGGREHGAERDVEVIGVALAVLDLPWPFEREYMQLALAAGLVVGACAPLIGVFLVQQRMALLGDGIGHLAFAGVAAGLLLEVWPVWSALVVAAAGALVIQLLRRRGAATGDLALALLFYGGIALGIVLISSSGAGSVNVLPYLFGSILTVEPGDVWVVVAIGITIVVSIAVLGRVLLASVLDEEAARVAGLPVDLASSVLAVLTAVTVVAAMRVVGVLLVAALDGAPRGLEPPARPVVPLHADDLGARRRRLGRRRPRRCTRVVARAGRDDRARRDRDLRGHRGRAGTSPQRVRSALSACGVGAGEERADRQLLEPRLPLRLLTLHVLGRGVGEELPLDHSGARALAHAVRVERQEAGHRRAEAEKRVVVGHVLDGARETARGDRLADLVDAEVGAHGRHDRVRVAVGGHLRLEQRDALAGEVGEEEPQPVEERPPSLLHLVEELLLPVGAGAERARHDAQDARAPGPRLDEELGDDRRRPRPRAR